MEFVVTGRNLLGIPSDAVAIPSADNDTPTAYINVDRPDFTGLIVEQTNTMIKFSASESNVHDRGYLGCIVSADRQTIYWINESRPLP